jgi:hypothetical protein
MAKKPIICFIVALSIAFAALIFVQQNQSDNLTAADALEQLEPPSDHSTYLEIETPMQTNITPKPPDDIPRYKAELENIETIEQVDADLSEKYERVKDFGTPWQDTDKNGCDTRNDILKRDILKYDPTSITYKDKNTTKQCKVNSGDLFDPYTGQVKHFQYGSRTSSQIQIDHKIALKDAWLTGAQQWDYNKRVQFANSPDELIAVDGLSNIEKSDGLCWNVKFNLSVGNCNLTGTLLDEKLMVWLPPNKNYWCDYISDIVDIRKKWGLNQTPQQYIGYKTVLYRCAFP